MLSTISKEILNSFPIVDFSGQITIVDSCDKVCSAIEILEKEKIIGFDTETKPSFAKGQTNKIALVQLATSDACFLFRLNKIGANKELFDFLSNPSVIKVGLSLDNDFLALRRLVFNFVPQSFEDIQHYAKNYGIGDMSLQKIYAILFQQKISKRQRLSNWEADVLSEAQMRYAAIDAWCCLKIYYKLKDHSHSRII